MQIKMDFFEKNRMLFVRCFFLLDTFLLFICIFQKKAVSLHRNLLKPIAFAQLIIKNL